MRAMMVAIKLGADSYRQGRTMHFDPATEIILDTPPPRPNGRKSDGTNLLGSRYKKLRAAGTRNGPFNVKVGTSDPACPSRRRRLVVD